MQISQKAIDLIVREEVSSKAYYERHFTHPEWPGGASGVTVGIGYDLGYATPDKIRADWGPLVSANMMPALLQCAGIKGESAKALLPTVKASIEIGWDEAMAVFMGRDVPQWTSATVRALPNCDLLTPTCLGVLVSLDYNRGVAGYTASGDRYDEMRSIKSAMVARNFGAIPGYLDSMARLWTSGVAGRRHREADLFRQGMGEAMAPTTVALPEPDPDVIASSQSDKPARTKPPATTPAQHGTAGAIVAGPVTAAAHYGLSPSQIAFVVVASIMLAAGVWMLWYQNRNPK